MEWFDFELLSIGYVKNIQKPTFAHDTWYHRCFLADMHLFGACLSLSSRFNLSMSFTFYKETTTTTTTTTIVVPYFLEKLHFLLPALPLFDSFLTVQKQKPKPFARRMSVKAPVGSTLVDVAKVTNWWCEIGVKNVHCTHRIPCFVGFPPLLGTSNLLLGMIPSLKRSQQFCTWTWMVGIRSFPFGVSSAYFQGRTCC